MMSLLMTILWVSPTQRIRNNPPNALIQQMWICCSIPLARFCSTLATLGTPGPPIGSSQTILRGICRSGLRKPLESEDYNCLRAECPRPTIPGKVSATPEFDSCMVTYMAAKGRDPRKDLEKGLRSAQDKLLDVSGPMTQIFVLADEAMQQATPLDHAPYGTGFREVSTSRATLIRPFQPSVAELRYCA